MSVNPVITQQPGQGLHLQPCVITTQPGATVRPIPGSVWMTIPRTIPGVPPGLEYLTHLEMVMIYQIREPLHLMFNWEPANRYVMKNANGEQCYYAFEESDSCDRTCYGHARGFKMHVVDNFQREVLTIDREFMGCFECCGGSCEEDSYNHNCTVLTPSTGVLGTVKQVYGCCKRTDYHVFDQTGKFIFEIDGPDGCELNGCSDMEFSIRAAKSEIIIGIITKKWTGWLRETFTKADTFFVGFPKGLDVKLKGLLLGATFLVDFVHFEHGTNST